MLKSEGRRLFSFPQLISEMGLIYLLSVSSHDFIRTGSQSNPERSNS